MPIFPHYSFDLETLYGSVDLNGRYAFRDGGQAIDLDAITQGLNLE